MTQNAAANRATRRPLTKDTEQKTIIINRSGRSIYPEEKSVQTSGATSNVGSDLARRAVDGSNVFVELPFHGNDEHAMVVVARSAATTRIAHSHGPIGAPEIVRLLKRVCSPSGYRGFRAPALRCLEYKVSSADRLL
jgi:hypothetical protein